MDSSDKKLGIVVAAVILIIISGIVLFPYPTDAEKMVIKSADLKGFKDGFEWKGWIGGVLTMAGSSGNTSSEVVYWLNANALNESFIIQEELTVFNSNEACTRYFDDYPPQNDSMQVGDGSHGWYDNWTYANFRLAFVRQNVYVWLDVNQFPSGYSVHDPRTIAYELAQLQLDKIEQYLAQHPGAS